MEKSSQMAWKVVPLRHIFPLKVVPLVEVLLYVVVGDGEEVHLQHQFRLSGKNHLTVPLVSPVHDLGDQSRRRLLLISWFPESPLFPSYPDHPLLHLYRENSTGQYADLSG
jgi:hypothetical protein